MICDQCETDNQVYLIQNVHEFIKKDWCYEATYKKWFCQKCKWCFNDDGAGNTI